jgi:hypothetical protein
MQEYREQSQNVDENKAHHFFEGCESRAFGVPIGPNQALKGARNTTIWENEVRLRRRKGVAGKWTQCQQDKIEAFPRGLRLRLGMSLPE